MSTKNRYKFEGRTELPIIKNMREKFEEMFLFGELDDNCKKFGIREETIRKIVYSDWKTNQTTLNFDTIIRLSNMFDIPYEEFINYNALVDHNRQLSKEERKKEDEMLKQYNVGKKWEETIIDWYNKKGYFVYKVPTMVSGTVFDIFVARSGSCMMIECKHIDGDKLYYAGSGILKKRDELDHFVKATNNNIYIYVNSEKTGTWWTTWVEARPKFEEKGYIDINDSVPFTMYENKEEKV